MNKVITINLNGRAFQLEEHGYNQLKDYLADAHARLSADPDRDEILADLEQALADKCQATLGGSKNVVLNKELSGILHDMGPVAEPDADDPAAAEHQPAKPAKRFYLISEGSMIGGVCTGIAAYFNADVTIVRLLILLLAFITGGAVIVGYIVAMLIAPTAKTPEEKAAARGESFNSQELIDQARKKYAEVANKEHWDRVIKENKPAFSAAGAALRKALRVVAGVVAALTIITLMVLTAGAVSGGLTLATTGLLFNLQFTPTIQPWVLGVLLASAYVMVAVPLIFIAVSAYRYARNSITHTRPWVAAIGVIAVTIAASAAITLSAITPALRDRVHTYTTDGSGTFCIGICSDPSTPVYEYDF